MYEMTSYLNKPAKFKYIFNSITACQSKFYYHYF